MISLILGIEEERMKEPTIYLLEVINGLEQSLWLGYDLEEKVKLVQDYVKILRAKRERMMRHK